MADNGHCSSCQAHNSVSGCGSSLQTFQKLIGSTIESNESYIKLNNDYPKVTAKESYITNEVFNTLKSILTNIKDYGEKGTRNPTSGQIDNISDKNDNNIIYSSAYNTIVSALDKQQISSNSIITAKMIDDINQYIKTYNLNNDRCNVCNSSCQNCQGHVPDCNCDCDCNCACDCACACARRYCPPACFNGSSRILKENIQIFDKNAIDLIASTNIVSFNYINDKEKNYKVGFIAEETNEILASKNHNIMDMYNCIGVLLKAVQELSYEIEELKKNK